ncbi:hypothetical protein DFH07DRAFT_840073 [Mycena maculata]|uniref:Uncharacterized protein n=1 Tax=Mycena maculata TaxID=230809 RepID=A0AAD7MZZ7_9AGAR|nr:hypothetical protein DFH07DRAFT_840073 [Mycena maculata]
MPSLFKVFSLLALTVISGAFASPHDALAVHEVAHPDTTAHMAPAFEMPEHHKISRSLPELSSRGRVPCSLTNAQRLARHLPLKPPTRRASARRAFASPTVAASPANRGYVQVLSVDANGRPTGVLGYVSKTTSAHTQYVIGTSLADALLVEISGDHNLRTLNSDTPSPAFLGLVQGRDDTSSSLEHYLYLASTERTPPNATPQSIGTSFGTQPAESAVWTMDPATYALTVQWTNPGGALAPTNSFVQGGAIYFSDDPAAFNHRYAASVQRIAFVYVPA